MQEHRVIPVHKGAQAIPSNHRNCFQAAEFNNQSHSAHEGISWLNKNPGGFNWKEKHNLRSGEKVNEAVQRMSLKPSNG